MTDNINIHIFKYVQYVHIYNSSDILLPISEDPNGIFVVEIEKMAAVNKSLFKISSKLLTATVAAAITFVTILDFSCFLVQTEGKKNERFAFNASDV